MLNFERKERKKRVVRTNNARNGEAAAPARARVEIRQALFFRRRSAMFVENVRSVKYDRVYKNVIG